MSDLDVAVVGGGVAGLAAGIALLDAGVDSFAVLERADRIGGTWRDNVYPGVACDIPAPLYSLAARPHPGWSEQFAPGAEIRAYLERIAAEPALAERLRVGTPMRSAAWTGREWLLELGEGERVTAQSVIVACGRLTHPRLPAAEGLDRFRGPMAHTAAWNPGIEVAGARVVVAGTGASAVQLVPELVRRGAEVTLLQRSAAWIVPRDGVRYSDAQRAAWAADPDALRADRDRLYREGEARFASRSGDPVAAVEARAVALAHLRAQVSDPALRAALTPDYPFGCKRVLLSDDFYPLLHAGAVALEPTALAEVREHEVVAASGRRHPADILVFATGFETQQQPYARLVRGADGQTLAEHWGDGMRSAVSTMMPGFPDLYVVNGPNAALGHNSSILMIEAQLEFAVRRIADRRGPVEPLPAAELAFGEEIARRSVGTPWVADGCTSWYVHPRSRRLTLLWPGTVADFRAQLAGLERDGLRAAAGAGLAGAG